MAWQDPLADFTPSGGDPRQAQPAPQAASAADQPQAQQDPGFWQQAADLGTNIGSHIAMAVPGTLGMGGDIRDFIANAGEAGYNYLGGTTGMWGPMTPEEKNEIHEYTTILDALPTGADLRKAWDVGPSTPTTPAGKWNDQNLGGFEEFAPQAIAGGLKSIQQAPNVARKAWETAKSLLKYDVAPQVGGEAADKALQNLGVSDDARTLLDSLAQFGIAGVTGYMENPRTKYVATPQKIQEASNAAWNALPPPTSTMSRRSMQDFADDASEALNERGVFNDREQPDTSSALRTIQEEAAKKRPIGYAEMESLRPSIAKALMSDNENDRAAAKVLSQKYEDWAAEFQPPETTAAAAAALSPSVMNPADARKLFGDVNFEPPSLDPEKVPPPPGSAPMPASSIAGSPAQQWQNARDLAALSRKASAVQDALNVEGAKNPSAAIQKNFQKLLERPDLNFTPQERQMLQQTVNTGTGTVQSIVDKISHWGGPLAAIASIPMHGDFTHALEMFAEGQLLSGWAKRGSKTATERVGDVAGANIRSQYDPRTGQLRPMQKIPFRPGLRPALMVGPQYLAGDAVSQPAQPNSSGWQNPLADFTPTSP